jgi:hypothetical protein
MSLEELCRTQDALSRPGKIRTSDFGTLRGASFPVLPTFKTPHYSIVLAQSDDETIDRLISCFSESFDNPAKPE